MRNLKTRTENTGQPEAERADVMRWLPLLAASVFSWWPGHHPAVTRPAPIIKSVVTTKKVVALTFDDGPTRTWTPKVLQVLKENHVQATFFVIGKHATQRPVW